MIPRLLSFGFADALKIRNMFPHSAGSLESIELSCCVVIDLQATAEIGSSKLVELMDRFHPGIAVLRELASILKLRVSNGEQLH